MTTLSRRSARRLALVRGGLLKPAWTDLPQRARRRARRAAHAVIDRFGYLQVDSVSVAGARSHVLVLLSRLDGFDPALGEALLQPGEPLFEYGGHEASWLPLELYPYFEFRRREFRRHPWWGDVLTEHTDVTAELLRRIEDEGPLRSADMQGRGSRGWWDLKPARRVAAALWSAGELAIRERRAFQRTFDLTENVIPAAYLDGGRDLDESLRVLLLRALAGHGWATEGTLRATWRLRNLELGNALRELADAGQAVPCQLVDAEGRRIAGWARPADLELAERLGALRPRRDRGVLLSPFDPLLWDRGRVERLFGFRQVLEIFKPKAQREFGYYCLPVLAGDRLVARLDLKADRRHGRLRVLALHYEDEPPTMAGRRATRHALARYADSLELKPVGQLP